MAFVFLVEDGTGLAAATSYVSLAEADAYYEIDPNFSVIWAALDDSVKEFALSWASRILDQKAQWRGTPATTTQGLRWPRKGVNTRDGVTISSIIIPTALKHAVLELTKWLQGNDPTTGQDTTAIKKITVDVVSITYQDKVIQSTFPTIINQILTGLGYVKIGASGFARILKA